MIDKGYAIQKFLFGIACFGVPIVYCTYNVIIHIIKSSKNKNTIYYWIGFIILLLSFALGIIDLTGYWEYGYGNFWKISRVVTLFGIGCGMYLHQKGRIFSSEQISKSKEQFIDFLIFFSKYLMIISVLFFVLLL